MTKTETKFMKGMCFEKTSADYDSEEYIKWQESGYEGEEPKHAKIIRDSCSLETFRYWLKNESFGYEGEDLELPNEWTIIGNIFENPDLLPSPDEPFPFSINV